MKLAGVKFQIEDYFIYENGKVYRNVSAGKFEDELHCVRRIGKYKLCATHFNCALPYTVYHIIDTEKEIIYRSEDCIYSYINELVDAIKQLDIAEKCNDIKCDTCKLFAIQKELNGDVCLNTNDHYGNIVKIVPVYCPTCGKEL